MPQLRKRQKALQAELIILEGAVADQQVVLRLANNLESFLGQLQNAANTMDVKERQKLLRLVVKEILIDDDTIKIKHSIPVLPSNSAPESNYHSEIPGYLLRSGRHQPSFGKFVYEPISEILAG